MIRSSVEQLAASNRIVMMGEVVDATSYWNEDRTFILTDVTLSRDRMIQGEAGPLVTVTLLGGTMDGLTTLVVGGAELVPGRSYVLFLDRRNLPGARGVLTVGDHCQGVFDLVGPKGRQRAVSQASREALVADREGLVEAPGGEEGLPVEELIARVRMSGGAR